jgi:Circularly permutated YpsA SLOG family
MPLLLRKVISGGQTGVDQAALRAAHGCGVAIGGWCPPARACDDGTVPEVFPLQETPADSSSERPALPRSQRTEWNVRDSDATLVLWPGVLREYDAGTRWTAECAARFKKPLLTSDPTNPEEVTRVREWTSLNGTNVLNIAGPSERTSPGIGVIAERFVRDVLTQG